MSIVTTGNGAVIIDTESLAQETVNTETAVQTASEKHVEQSFARGQFASQLATTDKKYTTCRLDIFKPYRDAKGTFVSRGRMQGEIFSVLHRLDKGSAVDLTVDVVLPDGSTQRVTRRVHKHMSTPVIAGRVYGEVSFSFAMPDGTEVVSEVPVYRIVGIACNVKGKGKEYTY